MNTTDFPQALPPPGGPVIQITPELLARAVAASRESPRRRVILPFHSREDSTLHRMLNALQPGTYIRPHRHGNPPKDESLVVLQGAIACVIFDDHGKILRAPVLRAVSSSLTTPAMAGTSVPDPPPFGIDLAAGIWHTLVCLEPDTVLYEVKPGPYVRANDKDFAAWAPAEGTPEAEVLLGDWTRRLALQEG